MAAVKALCKFSSHNSAGVTQSFCVCVRVWFLFYFFLFFYFSFQKWASTLCYSPFIKPVFKQLLLGADL